MSLDCSRCDQDGDDRFSCDSSYEREQIKEKELLTCCFCGAPLEVIMLNTDDVTGEQRLLWACKNMKKKICFFPMGLPNEVFYLTRTADEKRKGFIPKPDIRLLPSKYRGLYPTVFGGVRTADPSSRSGTSMSERTPDICTYSTSTETPSTSRSVPSDNTTTDQLLQQDHESENAGAKLWCESVDRSSEKTIGSKSTSTLEKDVDDNRSISAVTNSDSSYSSTGANDGVTDEALADFICDQLHDMGVDTNRLEDEELLNKMADVMKKLKNDRRHGRNQMRHVSSSEYRVSLDHLYNLDVAPIKRRLNVISTDLTRAIAVMRSGCDVETMLNAIGGKLLVPAPPVKLSRVDNREELKRRVDIVLKKLASISEVRKEMNTPVEATPANNDSPGAIEWYEGEDGPSTVIPSDHTASSSAAEEERLNAIVQNSVRLQVANSAARRNAYRQKRMRGSVCETSFPTTFDQVPSALQDVEALPIGSYTGGGGTPPCYSSDLPNSAHSLDIVHNDSQISGCHEQLDICETRSDHILHPDLPSAVDIDFGLFDEFELIC